MTAKRHENFSFLNPSKEKPKVHIFVEHIEGNDWELPITPSLWMEKVNPRALR
jgi:hypothetical protein